MDCRNCLKLIPDYSNGILSHMLSAQVEKHLTRCGRCRSELLLLKKMEDALRTRRLTRAPAGFTERLMRKLPPVEQPVTASPLWVRPGVLGWGTAVTALAVLLTYFRATAGTFLIQLSRHIADRTQNWVTSVLTWLADFSLPPFPSVSPEIALAVGLTFFALFVAWNFWFVARTLTVLGE